MKNGEQRVLVHADIPRREPEGSLVPPHEKQRVNKHQSLTEQGRCRNRGHSAAKYINKEGGEGQLHRDHSQIQSQDSRGVTLAAGDGDENRVEEADHQCQHFDAEVPGTRQDQILRSSQQPQKGFRKRNQRDRDDDARRHGQGVNRSRAPLNCLIIPPAVGLGNLDAAAHSQARAKSRGSGRKRRKLPRSQCSRPSGHPVF